MGGRNILVPPKPSYPLHGAPLSPLGSPVRGSRSTAAVRRRRNLTYLAMFIIVTFLLGLIPPLRILLVANLIADIMLIVYLCLAVYMTVWPSQAERAPARRPEPAFTPRAAEGGF